MFDFLKKPSLEQKYKEEISQDYEDVTPIAEYFKYETGVTFDKQISILKNKVTTFCKKRKFNSFAELLESIKQDNVVKQDLIDCLTTNETYFYREFTQIEELVSLVKKKKNKVDILCAPSATGEEPYSIAIALLESGVSQESFNIVGIDINKEALKKAKEATYKNTHLRNLSSVLLEKYFIEENNIYVLKDTIKSNITFTLSNIFDESFRKIGKFDYIFSRNMLIYFDKKTKLKAIKILEDLRKDNNQDIFFGHADLF